MTLYADISGERLDAFLARTVENLSRSGAQKLLEEGCVLLRGKPGRKNDKLAVGDAVEVTIPEPKTVDIAPKEMALDILYEDDSYEMWDGKTTKEITSKATIYILNNYTQTKTMTISVTIPEEEPAPTMWESVVWFLEGLLA